MRNRSMRNRSMRNRSMRNRSMGGRSMWDGIAYFTDAARKKYRTGKLHFTHCKKLNLTNRNLTRKNLTRKNLMKANLSLSRLCGADLQGANLREADLRAAQLGPFKLNNNTEIKTNLRGAHLEGARLEGAHLEGANLTDAHLEGAHLEDADLRGADLTGTDLSKVYLSKKTNFVDTIGVNMNAIMLDENVPDDKIKITPYYNMNGKIENTDSGHYENKVEREEREREEWIESERERLNNTQHISKFLPDVTTYDKAIPESVYIPPHDVDDDLSPNSSPNSLFRKKITISDADDYATLGGLRKKTKKSKKLSAKRSNRKKKTRR